MQGKSTLLSSDSVNWFGRQGVHNPGFSTLFKVFPFPPFFLWGVGCPSDGYFCLGVNLCIQHSLILYSVYFRLIGREREVKNSLSVRINKHSLLLHKYFRSIFYIWSTIGDTRCLSGRQEYKYIITQSETIAVEEEWVPSAVGRHDCLGESGKTSRKRWHFNLCRSSETLPRQEHQTQALSTTLWKLESARSFLHEMIS